VNLKTDPCHRCNLFNPWFRQKNRSRKGEGRSAKMVTLWWKVERRFLRLSWFGYDFYSLCVLSVSSLIAFAWTQYIPYFYQRTAVLHDALFLKEINAVKKITL